MAVSQATSQDAGKLEFGISASNGSFGTLAYSTPTYQPNAAWIQVTASFVAPVSGDYLVVRPVEDNNTTDRCWIHVDDFILTGPPPPTPIDCDVDTYEGDTTILPLTIAFENDYTFAALNWVKMTGSVESGTGGDTLVVVRADQYIELNPPFESKIGTNALFNIAPCVPIFLKEDKLDETFKVRNLDEEETTRKLTKAEAQAYTPPMDYK